MPRSDTLGRTSKCSLPSVDHHSQAQGQGTGVSVWGRRGDGYLLAVFLFTGDTSCGPGLGHGKKNTREIYGLMTTDCLCGNVGRSLNSVAIPTTVDTVAKRRHMVLG